MPATRSKRIRTRDGVLYAEGMAVYEVVAFPGGTMFDRPTWEIIEHSQTWLEHGRELRTMRGGKKLNIGHPSQLFSSRSPAIEFILTELAAMQAALEYDAAEWRGLVRRPAHAKPLPR